MLYLKLALRNMRRSAKDHLIYMATLTMTAALMYAFLALGLSPDIHALAENMTMLTAGTAALSVVVALVSSFVVSYAVRFMLDQRKKEFALYTLLGMTPRTLALLFVLENGLLGLAAFGAGTLLGVGLAGIFTQLVNHIFQTPHVYQLTFSGQALAITLLLFVLMHGTGLLRSALILRRQQIVTLLYDSRKNDALPALRPWQQHLWTVLAVGALGLGFGLLHRGLYEQTNSAWLYLAAAAAAMLSGIYGLYRQVPLLLLTGVLKNKRLCYQGETLFYLGQLRRRLHDNGRLMAVTALLFTCSLTALFIGLTMGAGYRANMEAYYPYDAGIALDAPLTKESLDPLVSFVNERSSVTNSVSFYLYTAEDYAIEALALSDYNQLRAILGLEAVSLADDHYLVHCDTWHYEQAIRQSLAQQSAIVLAGERLEDPDSRIYTEPMEQYQLAGTKGYVLVVPDHIASRLPGDKLRLVLQLADGGYPELRGEIRRFLTAGNWQPQLQDGRTLPQQVTMNVSVKAWGLNNSLTGFTVLSFCGLYLSIVLILLSCTILAFAQLSALTHDQKSYGLLRQLGVSPQRLRRLLRQELATFFLIPFLLPVLVTLVLIFGGQQLFGTYMLQRGLIPLYGALTLAVFTLIYGLYGQATAYLIRRHIF